MSEVIVAGDDVVALATALGLAQTGIEVLHLRGDGAAPALGPPIVPWPALGLLERLGVLGDLLAAGQQSRARQLRVVRTGESITLDLDALGELVPYTFDLVCDEGALSQVLASHLAGQPSVHTVEATGVRAIVQDGDAVTVDLDQRGELTRHRARWLVAADGTNSPLRRLTGVGFPGFTWQEPGILALVDHDFSELGYAPTTLQIDDQAGAVVEQAGRGWRLACVGPLGLGEQAVGDWLAETVARTCAGMPGSVLAWRATRMHERTAAAYRAGRVLLAGEAAHATNDLSADGIVAGLMDSSALVDVLPGVVRGERDAACLDAYADSRRRDYIDRVLPASLDRMNLITQISDPAKLDTELDQYRRAVGDAEAQRELLLFRHRTLDGVVGF